EIGGELSYVVSSDKYMRAGDLKDELTRLRRGYWALILDTGEFRELLTSDARIKLKRLISAANEMDINYANIRIVLTALGAKYRDMLVDSIVSIFENITRYHMNEYSTNIHYYNGWKTNDAYRINKKVIIPISSAFDGWDLRDEYERLPYEVKNW